MKAHYNSLDLLKFLLSLFIVAIHSGLGGAWIYPIARIAVPVFFILSGFFTFRKINAFETQSDKNHVVWSITKRYLLLYAFWFILLFPVTVLLRGYFKNGIINGLLTIIKSFLFTSTFQGSWYLMACIQGILITYFLSLKLSNRTIFLITLPFYLFATATSKYSLLIQQNNSLSHLVDILSGPYPSPCGSTIISMMYIILGKTIADGSFKEVTTRTCLLTLAGCIMALLAEYGFLSRTDYFVFSCDCWFMLAPTALVITLLAMRVDLSCSFCHTLRKVSTLIYCSHMAIIYILSILFYKLNVTDTNGILTFTITLSLSLLMSTIFLHLEKHPSFKFLSYAH